MVYSYKSSLLSINPHHYCPTLLKVKVTQLCQTLCDSMDYTVHGILQARVLEWVTFLISRGSSQPRDRTQVSCIAGRFFTSWTTREPKNTGMGSLSLSSRSSPARNWTRVSCFAGRFFTNWAIREALLLFSKSN